MMRLSTIAAVLAAAGSISLASPSAEAQFPKHLKNCQKDKPFLQEWETYSVPVVGGGAGVVKVVSESFNCVNSGDRINASFDRYGMTDANGKVIVPFKYAKVLPYSTTGAVVSSYGEVGYKTYTAGKGEGKERFELQDALMLRPNNGCPPAPGDVSPRSVSAVIGETWFGVGDGKSHVTLFTPEGRARKLEYMGGDDLKPAVRRVGDVLLARWRDAQGVIRSGILDLDGRQIAPVLSNASLWITPKAGPGRSSVDGCDVASLDLFIEGPSLDFDPAKRFFGELLIPVGRDGQPAALPKGAIGMFPAYWRENKSAYSDAPRNIAAMWAVVFPKKDGFEFTLHLGAPSEALIAAETGARYSNLGRTDTFGGLVSAQAAADGKWLTFRSDTDIVVGEANADLDRALDSAEAVLAAEASQRQQALAAAWAKEEARRAEDHKRHWQTARSTGRLCNYRVDPTNTREEVEEYLAACGPGHFAGLADLARAKGVPEGTITAAAGAAAKREVEQWKARAAWEEEQRLIRMRTANKDPGASYMPGQWESAIRNAGNAAVDAINQSSDNWLEQRRDQYIADWQRSQRAY